MSVLPRPCQRCNAWIPEERVEALPETRLCIECSKVVGGDFDIVLTPENIGKTGSMKKNYGGLNVRKRRKDIPPISD